MTLSNASPRILIFDSGVGGLSVFSHISSALPNATYSYVMDDAFCPYGEHDDGFLLPRIISVIGRAIEQCQPQLVVVACNTASTLAIDLLREKFLLPFVGLEPALKPAVEETDSGAVLLLATEATLGRRSVDQLWARVGTGRQLIKVACTELVLLAEQKVREAKIDHQHLRVLFKALAGVEPLSDESDQRIAAIVLGCTHFPLLSEELKQAWPEPCQWFDSGAAISRRVMALVDESLNRVDTYYSALDQSKNLWWCTSSAASDVPLQKAFSRRGFIAGGQLLLDENYSTQSSTLEEHG